MKTPIFRTVDVAATDVALGGDEIFSFEASTPPTNAGNVTFTGPDGESVEWIPGEYHKFYSVRLSDILIRGTVGDKVTITGGTW